MNKMAQPDIIPNVLIVDDNPNNLFAMRNSLENMRLNLFQARSGPEALALLTQHEFALVLLDVQMPEMDGFETAGLMRMNKATKDVSIIFITAISKEEKYIKKGLELGAVDYLFKPIDPVILQSKVSVFTNYFVQQKQMGYLVNELNNSRDQLAERNEKLTHLIHVDKITEVGNRLNFEESLEQTLIYAKRENKIFAVLMLDLDNFKYVNDTFGHDCGDLLLRSVADRLRTKAEQYEKNSQDKVNWSVSRLGGDEFAIILSDITDPSVAGSIANHIIVLLSKPFYLQNNEIYISTSIGISCYPAAGDTADALIKDADIAMYRAKKSGKNQYQFYSETMHKNYLRHSQLEFLIKQALEKNEFYLMYQFIFDLHSLNPIGVEALCRWRNKQLGDVVADEFIPIAEETGVIRPLGKWVLQTAIKDMLSCRTHFQMPFQCHVNLSPKQLLDDEFVYFVQSIFTQQFQESIGLTFELTETSLMENAYLLETNLKILTQLGIKISADDFGTGYSSLHRLVSLPISSLKIDKTFVQLLPEDTMLIKSILGLSDNLNLITIAEGIETEQQLQLLKKFHCCYGQGFYFAKPMVIEDLVEFLKEFVPNKI